MTITKINNYKMSMFDLHCNGYLL